MRKRVWLLRLAVPLCLALRLDEPPTTPVPISLGLGETNRRYYFDKGRTSEIMKDATWSKINMITQTDTDWLKLPKENLRDGEAFYACYSIREGHFCSEIRILSE